MKVCNAIFGQPQLATLAQMVAQNPGGYLVCGHPGSKGRLILELTELLQQLGVPTSSWSLDPMTKMLYPPYGTVPASEGSIFNHLMASEGPIFQHMLKPPGAVLLVDGWMLTKASRRSRIESFGSRAMPHCIWCYPTLEELIDGFTEEFGHTYTRDEASLVLEKMKVVLPSFKEGFGTIWYVNPLGTIQDEQRMGLYFKEVR